MNTSIKYNLLVFVVYYVNSLSISVLDIYHQTARDAIVQRLKYISAAEIFVQTSSRNFCKYSTFQQVKVYLVLIQISHRSWTEQNFLCRKDNQRSTTKMLYLEQKLLNQRASTECETQLTRVFGSSMEVIHEQSL